MYLSIYQVIMLAKQEEGKKGLGLGSLFVVIILEEDQFSSLIPDHCHQI